MTKEERIHNGENTVPSINGADKMGQLYVKEKLEHSLMSYTKINWKWIKYLKVRLNHKLPRRKHRQNTLWRLSLRYIFSDMSSQIKETKVRINKWDLIKFKSSCYFKGNDKQDEKTTLRMGGNNCKWNN